MSIHNQPDLGGVPSFANTREHGMACFDALPASIRAAVRDLPIDVATPPVLNCYQRRGEHYVLGRIGFEADRLFTALRAEMEAATGGPAA